MFPYDPTLLAAVQPTPQSVSEVRRIFGTIETTCADGDGLKWFNWLYLQVTEAVAARIDAGGFTDPAWLAQLDVQFGRLYFSALKSSLSGKATPGCWQILFDRRNQGATARIQFALAGINAHINHDLAQAIVATCKVTGTSPDHGGTQYRDYTALNSTLDGLVESAKRTLHVDLLGGALPPVSQLEDTIAAWNIAAARESAWLNAQHLWQFRTIPILGSSFIGMLDGFTTVIGKTLLVRLA